MRKLLSADEAGVDFSVEDYSCSLCDPSNPDHERHSHKGISKDAHFHRISSKNKTLEKKYRESLKENARLAEQAEAAFALKAGTESFSIKSSPGKGEHESVAFMVASDWHVEEIVRKPEVNGLNEYSLKIAEERAVTFFKNGVRLLKMFSRDTKINTIVLALLGDFITGQLHDDSAENNQLTPVEAALFAQRLLASGIEYLLKETKCNLIIPCHSGNHGRVTKKVHNATERGHSLEYFMYRALQDRFANEKRIKFIISEAYHSYLTVFGKTIRFSHGHKVNYYGGVGGVTIPLKKSIHAWNRAKYADLDVMGHFHSFLDGGSFIVNGSMIGYNAYAVAIKAEYEPPRQAMFLWHEIIGKTVVVPIVFCKEV